MYTTPLDSLKSLLEEISSTKRRLKKISLKKTNLEQEIRILQQNQSVQETTEKPQKSHVTELKTALKKLTSFNKKYNNDLEDMTEDIFSISDKIKKIKSILFQDINLELHENIQSTISSLEEASKNPSSSFEKFILELDQYITLITNLNFTTYEENPNKAIDFVYYDYNSLKWRDLLSIRDNEGKDISLYDLINLTKSYYRDDFKANPKDNQWPVNLPIPAKRMTAPKSHFG